MLEIVKGDDNLKSIPVVMLTTSSAEEDVVRSYDLGVNCFISKPVEFETLMHTIAVMENYWLQTALLPPNAGKNQKKSGEGSTATL